MKKLLIASAILGVLILAFLLRPKPSEAALVGDINHDGTVNMGDITILTAHYNSVKGDSRYYAPADINQDGVINIGDICVITNPMYYNKVEGK